jgi:hypothetical protein
MTKEVKKQTKEFPAPIAFGKLLGPSFVLLALGLGSGELILWPYLVANYGLGIVWAAALGITFQYFINMEVERYALIKGESVFVGLAKMWRWTPIWFIVSTFISFALPGIVAASAQVLSFSFGWTDFKWLAMGLLVIIGLTLSFGKTVYASLEKINKIIIFLGVPAIFLLTLFMAKSSDVLALAKGMIGQGDGYSFIPKEISWATFLAAFAYAGAGGNLNLSQSIYAKEKGYGMGKYAQKIAGLFHKKSGHQEIKLAGEEFELNEKNVARFKIWWKLVNAENLFVFWFLGLLSIILLMLLSYITAYGHPGNTQGFSFIVKEGLAIGRNLMPIFGTLFLFVIGMILFQAQLGIIDSTSRIMAESFALKIMAYEKVKRINLSKIYYCFVWAQIAFGIILFLFNFYEPKTLIVLGAVISAIAMFVHVGLVNRMNLRVLAKPFRPSYWRRAIMLIIFLFLGVFSVITLWDKFLK